ncbi:MAG: 30S ribosomal protein S4 [Candidatus Nanoarchaeia archaeon]|nr:30S ribosomal protein S4 [Candidatus Nanoarchaeia archaeon]MDD5239819.1 30S ribosomal protein S4 [Candidatus Nanoarchaeia archaeon]
MVRAKLRKKYSGPSHLWQMERIKEEAQLKHEYGYKNKKELWKMTSILRNFRGQARKLIPLTSNQAAIERKQLLNRLISLGLVKEDARLENVLGLTIKDIMDRRLQTIVLKKRLANTVKQARQFITHGHINVGENKVTSPSMLVKFSDENLVSFSGSSAMVNEAHAERVAGREKRERRDKKEVLEEKMRKAREDEKKKKEEEVLGISKAEIEEIEKLEVA